MTGERAAEMFGALAALFTEGGDGSSDDFLASEGESARRAAAEAAAAVEAARRAAARTRQQCTQGTGRREGAIIAPQEGAGSRAVAVGIVVVQRGRKRLADGYG